MKKPVASAAVALSILGGAGAGALLFTPGIVGAQTNGSSSTTPSTTTSPADRLAETLKPRVDNGTITQAQADAVRNALKSAGIDHGGKRGPGGPGGAGMGVGRGQAITAAAGALGVSEADLKTALQSGKSLADVAADKGVDVQKVIDAIVAAEKTEIEQAVTDGKITRDQADKAEANLTQRVTDMVNKAGKGKGMAGPGMGGRGRRGPAGAGQAPAGGPSGSTSTSGATATQSAIRF
ncbi:MAG: hypothetical protein AB7O61_00690 [Acidimicrobiia bacterium]